MRKSIVVLLLLLGVFNQIEAQKILVLDKIGIKLKRIKYYAGDFIAIKIFDDRVVYKGEITSISDTSFFINSNYVAIDSVESIIKYRKGAKAFTYTAFSLAAITTLVLLVDQSIKGNIESVPSKLTIPAAFAGMGLIALPFWRRSYRIGENKVLKVIDLSPI